MVNYNLLSTLKEIGCTDTQSKLLCLWVRYPKAKLTLSTIALALDISKNDLKDAIIALIGNGIISAQCNKHGITYYALSDQWRQEHIGEIDRLD